MNVKRILCAALALCFMLAALPAVSAAETETYYLYVAGVQVTSENKDDLSVIDGVSGVAFFDPESFTLTLKDAEESPDPFEDVDPEDWFYDAVLWAVKLNITRGTSATTFSPYDGCTRGQVVTFLYRCA